MIVATLALCASAAPSNYVQHLMHLLVKDKSKDPTQCLTQLFQNYAAITNCASRTCTCSGGSWSTTAPYCTGPNINCDNAAKCYPVGNQCLQAAAPDCEQFFLSGCQEAATAAGCNVALCNATATAKAAKVRRPLDVHKAKRGHALASKVLAAMLLKKKSTKPIAVASPASDALEQVLLGLVEGIEGDVGNITRCLPEEEGAFQDLELFVSEIAEGIKNGNSAEIADAFQKLISAVSLAQRAAADCGLDTVAADLATIIAELETPGGWLKVLEDEGWKVFIHARDITADLLDATTDWRSGNYNAFGQDIGRILGLLL